MGDRSVMWFRRDLRLADNPALASAIASADDGVVPLFVVDDRLWKRSGAPRLAYLCDSLRSLRERIGGLVIRHGAPADEVPEVAQSVGAVSVHIADDFGPYGSHRDARLEEVLAARGLPLVREGSAYAVPPGSLSTANGTAYRVFTPFARAWAEHGWPPPVPEPRQVDWLLDVAGAEIPPVTIPDGLALPAAGELAARSRWRGFLAHGLKTYADDRDRPDRDATSRMSVHLKWGEIHPRTMLADLSGLRHKGADVYRRELGWREFYADVLRQHPATLRDYLRPEFAGMQYDQPGEAFAAWTHGRTGFPIVDAGMRQLRSEAWMHNRVRMVVASFLVKDLHVEWQHGARHFMRWLVDGDVASNHHGWQWTAGSGTDAAPYFRVFNPTAQGKKFDPDGDYVRRHVPELRGLDSRYLHEPWTAPGGLPRGYPERIVDHAAERVEALRRYEEIRR
jgi:deoxyribodipyrimidine photo-lyase